MILSTFSSLKNNLYKKCITNCINHTVKVQTIKNNGFIRPIVLINLIKKIMSCCRNVKKGTIKYLDQSTLMNINNNYMKSIINFYLQQVLLKLIVLKALSS